MEEEKPKNKFVEIVKSIFKGIFNIIKMIITGIQNYMKSQWLEWDKEAEKGKKHGD
jgi:hypothetical protein